MAQCRKCGLAIRFERRCFSGVLKWCPTNPDGSEHWDTCKQAMRRDLSKLSPEERMREANLICPPVWTLHKPEGGYRVIRKKPDGWDSAPQPAPIEELVDWDGPPAWITEANAHLGNL